MTTTSPHPENSNGITSWFISNPVAANLLMIVLIFGGFLSAMSLQTEEFPSINPSSISVSVAYPGATPDDVAEGIIQPLEHALLGMNGIKKVTAIGREGSASFTLEAGDFADLQELRDETEMTISGLRRFLPKDAEAPVVTIPSATTGVVAFAITGDIGEDELKHAAQTFERELLAAPGVSLVSLLGARETELSINVDENALQSFGLSFDEIANAIRSNSVNASAGALRTTEGGVLLRTDQRQTTAEDIGNLTIRSDEAGRQIKLSDVAEVKETFVRGALANTFNGQPAIFVQVSRSAGEDLLQVKKAVDAFLESYEPPVGVDIIQFQDQTAALRDRLGLIIANGVSGFVLVLTFLALVVDFRLAFWVSIGIATAFIAGFILSSLAGISLNGIALFGLLVAIGLVVDDAIVVGEAIDRARASGKGPRESAIEGLTSVRAPVFVGVATTIGAFSPLLLASGELSEFVRHIPIVVIATLLVSLVEAFLILPSHLAHPGDWSRPPLSSIQKQFSAGLEAFAHSCVRPIAMLAARMRYAAVTLGGVIVFLSIALVQEGAVKTIFFPSIEPDVVSVTIDMPEGTPFHRTKQASRQLEEAAKSLADELEAEFGKPIVTNIAVTTGGQIGGVGVMASRIWFFADEADASLQLELIPSGDREISAPEIETRWREIAGKIEGAKKVSFNSSLTGFGADIAFNLSAPNETDLITASERLKEELLQMEGVRDVSSSLTSGKPELKFELTPAGIASGLTTKELSRQLRQAFFGEEIDRIQRGHEDLMVRLRYSETMVTSVEDFSQVRVRLADGSAVPLLTVASISEARAPASIRHENGQQVISVYADVDETVISPRYANTLIQSDTLPTIADTYSELSWQISGSAEAQNEDLASIGRVFLLVMVIIYATIAVQLRAYVLPFAILLTMPLALAGAIFAHGLLDIPLSFLSLFGVIALTGVSVNASIVLMDEYLKGRASGIDRINAAANATERRFRPILLTTLTTALGLAPIISETSPQAQFLIPIAVSLSGGILVSGALVLFVTPAAALIIDDIASIRIRRATSDTGQPTA